MTAATKRDILDDFYTPDELAAALGFSREHVMLMGRKRDIVPTKIGRRTYFHTTDVDAYLRRCRRER